MPLSHPCRRMCEKDKEARSTAQPGLHQVGQFRLAQTRLLHGSPAAGSASLPRRLLRTSRGTWIMSLGVCLSLALVAHRSDCVTPINSLCSAWLLLLTHFQSPVLCPGVQLGLFLHPGSAQNARFPSHSGTGDCAPLPFCFYFLFMKLHRPCRCSSRT